MQNYKHVEREVIVLDYVYNVLKNWRRILFMVVLFSFLFGGVKYILDKKAIQEETQKNQNEKYEKKDVLDRVAMLPAIEKSDVETVIKLTDMMESEKAYSESARIMQLDSNNVSKEILQYYVISKNNVPELLELYSNCIFSEDMKEAIVAASNQQIEESDITDIITAETNERISLIDGNTTVEDNSLSLDIIIRGIDKENLQNIVQLIEDCIDANSVKAQEFFGPHSIELLNSSYFQGRDVDVDKIQKDIYNSIYNTSNQIKQLTSSMNDNQLQLIQQYNIAIKAVGNDKNNDIVIQKTVVNKKWILLGALFGVLIVAVIEGLKWLVGGKLYSVEEWKQNFQIYTYGVIRVSSQSNSRSVIDRWIEKLKNRSQTILPIQQQYDMLSSRIIMSAKSEQIKKIYMISSEFIDLSKLETVIQLQRKAKEGGIEILTGENIFQNQDSFVKMLEVGYVVLLEEIGDSGYQKILQVLQVCEEYQVKVMGSVILEH